MPSNPQLFNHISKKFKSNDNSGNTSQPTNIISKSQAPSTLSPPNVNPKDDKVLDQLLNDQLKRSPKRLFFDHSSRMLIDKPSPDSDGTNHKIFVSFNPSNPLEKEDVANSSKSKEQSMNDVLSLDPEKKFFESMEEMVRTRLENNLIVDSDYLEELLSLYLIHNEKSMYGHIYSAYTRVVVDLSHTFA